MGGVGHADPFLLALLGMNCVDLTTDRSCVAVFRGRINSLDGNRRLCRRSPL
ncbi:hypothetical protein GWL_24580 [Herbaspirillum sp. GW103]|nr:hypothetical protein GWL_24580 [Herbaspirillum sp. GW103]